MLVLVFPAGVRHRADWTVDQFKQRFMLVTCCVQFLSECKLRPPAGPEGQTKTGDEEDGVVSLQDQRAEGAFQLVGTASDPPEEDRGFVMEDYRVSTH